MKFRGVMILAGLLILSGCATLSEKECLRGDWRDLGIKDGLNGEPAVQIEKHREACTEHGIRPDERLYMEGRAEGLLEYCQLDNAFWSGLNGRQYQGVCPPAIHSLFKRYNEAAYGVYQTREKIKQLHDEISSSQRKLESKKTKDKERIHIRGEIREREKKLDELRNDLRDRERNLDDLMEEARYRNRR
jgi:hypothetical protein